jgi:hypothetical protein
MARYQWLLMVAIAVGLVGMHHLVHTHPAHTMTSAIHPDSAGASPSAVLSTSMMGSGTDCCDPMNMVGHLCLAVLTAIAALAAALIVAAAWRRGLVAGHVLAAVSAVAARAPPIGCARFTQLCVLRR